MENKNIDPYYQIEAKRIIDTMFDTKVFNEKMTRNDMQGFEDLIAFYFHSHAKTVKKCLEFTLSVKHLSGDC